jgi:hypothetical protein
MKTKEKKTKPRRRTTSPKNNAQQPEFPGYPLYSPEDDIMNQGERVGADVENIKAQDANKATRVDEIPQPTLDDEPDISPKDEYAVTEEDLQALGPADLSNDGGDDEDLKHRTRPVDFAAKDLDIPGSELDDQSESVGSEDEENNSYSIGGDDHNDLEEDPA